jgi:hypothetical protein
MLQNSSTFNSHQQSVDEEAIDVVETTLSNQGSTHFTHSSSSRVRTDTESTFQSHFDDEEFDDVQFDAPDRQHEYHQHQNQNHSSHQRHDDDTSSSVKHSHSYVSAV